MPPGGGHLLLPESCGILRYSIEKEGRNAMTLEAYFASLPKAAVAFSGGADSAFLLWAAQRYGCHVTAYYAETAFQPSFELADAQRLAAQLDVPMHVVNVDILAVPGAAENGRKRCYHCKKALFAALWDAARRDGHTTLLEGTNASDSVADRPGFQALAELEVVSPLRLCGLTKQEVRQLSREAGLFTWNKPAYACLATRIPTGTPITLDALEKAARAESALARLGFTDFRVRLLGENARIQLPEAQFPQALNCREQILSALRRDFSGVLLDLYPREGE